jgi:hypothetical protein
MGATLQQIASYLDNKGWKYKLDEDECHILTGVYAENIPEFLIVIQLDEDGEFFELFAPRVLSGVNNHPHKAGNPSDDALHFLGNQNAAMGV